MKRVFIDHFVFLAINILCKIMQKVKFVCRHGFSWLARPPTLVHEPVREHGGADQDLLQEVTAKDVERKPCRGRCEGLPHRRAEG